MNQLTMALKYLILVSIACIAYGYPDTRHGPGHEEGVKAMKATLASSSNNADNVNGEEKCYYLCPNYVYPSLNWCCTTSVPVCAGLGYCCPYQHPNFYNGLCY